MNLDFSNKWRSIGEEHIIADQSNQTKFNLGSAAMDFLFISGMPSEFQDLNFDYLKEKSIQTVNEKWNLENSNFDKYLAIGFNGSGDPVTINQNNQELAYLNHDNEFQEIFINSNMKKFAQCVLRIQEFMNQITKLTPESFFETEFTDESYNNLLTDLKRIDKKLFGVNPGHWFVTLDSIKWEREEERKNLIK